jgi:Alcohol dehydrogenase transcription factor Myb/SANT-like
MESPADKVKVEEQLIGLVFDAPHLYTKKANSHHDAQLVENSWQEISKKLNMSGETFQQYVSFLSHILFFD